MAADDVIQKHVCAECQASPSAGAPAAGNSAAGDSGGDFCIDRLTRTCPLSRYGRDVLEVLAETMREVEASESKVSS